MAIVGLLIAIVGGIAAWSWRAQRAAEAARELEGIARTAANLPRKLAFKRKTGKAGLQLVDDPREAATLMMVEIGRAGREFSRETREVIEEIIINEFELETEDADALVAHATFMLRDAPVADAVMTRMSKMIFNQNAIGPKEIVDLDSMLVAVSEADGLPNADQLMLLQTFRNVVGLRT
ncbi:MAG: hypothetical protein AAF216_05755 [Pseudomonadota bacterium]